MSPIQDKAPLRMRVELNKTEEAALRDLIIRVNTGIKLQFSTGMELQGRGLKEVNDSHFHPVLHPV